MYNVLSELVSSPTVLVNAKMTEITNQIKEDGFYYYCLTVSIIAAQHFGFDMPPKTIYTVYKANC